MTVGIVGLGLIGGSAAKAYKKHNETVLSYDINNDILNLSIIDGVTDKKLTKENIGECDIILIGVYPKATIEYMKENAPYIRKDTIVIDLCGTKRKVCEEGFAIAEKFGFSYLGGHPMAGTHNSGYTYSKEDLFCNAPMVIVPPKNCNEKILKKAEELLKPMEFGFITPSTAEKHDKMIAFTSQLAHIVSNAYIKSPTALEHEGFSAGSYKDLTRVAWLNPIMWAELFLDNKDNLLFEIDTIMNNLSKYKKALENNDREELEKLLDEGRRLKKEVDG